MKLISEFFFNSNLSDGRPLIYLFIIVSFLRYFYFTNDLLDLSFCLIFHFFVYLLSSFINFFYSFEVLSFEILKNKYFSLTSINLNIDLKFKVLPYVQ
jgi:hypothetical protein